MQHSLQCAQRMTCSLGPILCKPRDAVLSSARSLVESCGAPEPSLQEPFIDFYAESPCEKIFSGNAENFAPPQATAPPLDDADDELTAFGKGRSQTRDAMIQVEGIPNMMYIMVDFCKWGSPNYREMLKKRNEKRKIKKVSFAEVHEVFPGSPTFYFEDTRTLKASGSGTECNSRLKSSTPQCVHSALSEIATYSPKQAFGLRKKPALYVSNKKKEINVFSI